MAISSYLSACAVLPTVFSEFDLAMTLDPTDSAFDKVDSRAFISAITPARSIPNALNFNAVFSAFKAILLTVPAVPFNAVFNKAEAGSIGSMNPPTFSNAFSFLTNSSSPSLSLRIFLSCPGTVDPPVIAVSKSMPLILSKSKRSFSYCCFKINDAVSFSSASYPAKAAVGSIITSAATYLVPVPNGSRISNAPLARDKVSFKSLMRSP